MPLLRRIADELHAMTLREAYREVTRCVGAHELPIYSGAIAFQTLFAIIPLVLFGLGLLGGIGLQEQWTDEWSQTVRDAMSPAAFQVVDDTVRKALGEQQTFWLTAGALLSIWRISATTRTIMSAFDRIHECRRDRPFTERMRVSLTLGVAVTSLLLAAAGCVVLGDEALRAIGIETGWVLWLRWPIALAMLFAVVALLVAYAPADRQPPRWVTFGAILVVAAWTLASLFLGIYITQIADYDSIFGALATVVIVLAYLYVASGAVLTGAQLDALVRERVDDRG
jgi:membrane protein